MFSVPITQWGAIEDGQSDGYHVFEFLDSQTINRAISEPKDFGLGLKEVGGRLYDHQKEVVAVKRNQNNDAWLALCKKVE